MKLTDGLLTYIKPIVDSVQIELRIIRICIRMRELFFRTKNEGINSCESLANREVY